MNCPFCNIDENKNRVLAMGKYSYAMLSNPRIAMGHLLVIPNRHILNIRELQKEELIEIYNFLVMFEDMLLKTVASGCDIRQNYRPFLKQDEYKVDHVHFHLVPRTHEDEIFQKAQKLERTLFHRMDRTELHDSLKLFTDIQR